jgi:hypothetical protein
MECQDMNKRNAAYWGLGALALLLATIGGARAEEAPPPAPTACEQKTVVNTDRGNGGMQITHCGNSVGIGFGGPIRDVDIAHPLGKGDAFFPKAGRDTEKAVHWVGDRLGIHF